MSAIFSFGERLEGYAVPVLNERAVRAGAGIVFFFAIVSFMNAWLIGNFQPTRVFVVARAVAPAAVPAPATPAVDAAEAERCKVPDFAKAMGHEEKWKLHNNCK
ncbi:MAG: hypothetical protein IPG93_19280 [Burkholderiales bacterium]|nr:hypothetical protein [Burkholderiales bacterium]